MHGGSERAHVGALRRPPSTNAPSAARSTPPSSAMTSSPNARARPRRPAAGGVQRVRRSRRCPARGDVQGAQRVGPNDLGPRGMPRTSTRARALGGVFGVGDGAAEAEAPRARGTRAPRCGRRGDAVRGVVPTRARRRFASARGARAEIFDELVARLDEGEVRGDARSKKCYQDDAHVIRVTSREHLAIPSEMFAFTSNSPRARTPPRARAPRTASPSRARARARAVVADAVTTGRAVWLAEDGRKPTMPARSRRTSCSTWASRTIPTESFAPVNDIRFEAGSEAVAVTVERPLGIVFEEKIDGVYTKIVVDEILPGSNAEKAATCASATSCASPPPCSTSPASWTSRRGSTPPRRPTARRSSSATRKGSTR